MRLVEADDDDVRFFAGFQRTGDMIHVQGLRTFNGCHPYDRFCVHDGRIKPGDLMKFCGRRHLPDHIQRVVAGASVCAKTNSYAGFEHVRNGRNSACQFHIACRMVRYLASVFCKKFYIVIR